MKFSDILKRKNAEGPGAAPPPREAPPATAAPRAPGASPSLSLVADEPDEALEKRLQTHAETATEIYSEAVSAARQIYRAAAHPAGGGNLAVPQELLQKIIAALQTGNQELMALADRSAPDNYLYGHAVNVTVFSVRLGLAMNLPAADLAHLAAGAFLHDIGMGPYMPLALKPAPLAESELGQIRRHPAEGQKLLALFPDLAGMKRETVFQIVGQVHERSDGSGYPDHRGAESIHRFSKIVAVCDVYEALTHARAWRGRYLPHAALRQLIEKHERAFEPGSVKSLIEALSLYPPGSFVRLSSGDVGRVVQTNPGLPTRPKVKTLMTSGGARIPEPKILNLATQPILYIADAVDETRIETSDQRLLLELKAQRWWVKGL